MGIAEALRQASEKAGWSPAKIAAECGVTEGSARSWLKGQAMPRGDALMALRRALPSFAELLDTAAA